MSLSMFTDTYERPFFHQLISSQLDVDRLDYLNRDSFFTGVSEGTIGAERIIKLFDIVDDQIVVEEKGIYSVENFLNARRLMYWQVYLHKTGLAADRMLVKIIERARMLTHSNYNDPNLQTSISQQLANEDLPKDYTSTPTILDDFSSLDDHDIWCAIKQWQKSSDNVLAYLCKSILNRKLFKIRLFSKNEIAFKNDPITELRENTKLSDVDVAFLYDQGILSNAAYINTSKKIKLLKKSGEVINIEDATDLPNIKSMSRIVSKNYICWANEVFL
jgi:HD superfamily phosphohydrolase